MASIEERKQSFHVRWRDETGRQRREVFRWGQEDWDGSRVTRDQARELAEGSRSDYALHERRHVKKWAHVQEVARWHGYRPSKGQEQFGLAAYLRAIIINDRNLRDSTREMYLRNLRVHLDGTSLGESDVRAVEADQVVEYWDGLDLGKGALRNVHQLLSKAFNRAVQEGIIDVSPLKRAPHVKRPGKQRQAELVPLSVPQIEALADAAGSPRDRCEILLMAYGGLRAGEVGGLRLQDVDPDRGLLRVRQQVVRISGRTPEVGPLKTKAAARSVSIPRSLADELAAYMATTTPASDGRIFTGKLGAPRSHTDLNHSVHAAAKRAGLTAHAHQLRHTAVSLWIDDGASPVDVQHMVGHADVRMTLGTYSHLFTYGGEDLAQSMERRRAEHRARSDP